jgi:hypothetical protein
VACLLLKQADRVELMNMKRGSRFRIVADVYIDGESLTGIMIGKDYGRAYNRKRSAKHGVIKYLLSTK